MAGFEVTPEASEAGYHSGPNRAVRGGAVVLSSPPGMATESRYLAEVKRIVLRGLGPRAAKVYFFGSRASGAEHRYSDVDVAVLPLEPIPHRVWLELQERLEQSWVPFPVDLVNLEEAPAELRARVEREGVLWSG